VIIRDQDFKKVANGIKPDAKNRVALRHVHTEDGVTYHMYTNTLGQIVLDPQVTIPASELWVFEHKDVLASIDKGMAESAKGKLIKRDSFAKHVKNAT